MSDVLTRPTTVIGTARPRIDGPLKVTGKAEYASDRHLPGMLYAVPVGSTVAKGEIQALDVQSAERMPGVRAILHHKNIGKLYRPAVNFNFAGETVIVDEKRPPFEDNIIRYYGQYVALVVADTFEQAVAAADAVKVTYRAEKADVSSELMPQAPPPEKPEDKKKPEAEKKSGPAVKVDSERGNAEKGYEEAPIKIDHTYSTPVETHNPIELHSTVAVWDGQNFTLHESTQAVVNHQTVLAQMLGVPKEQVRVISKFLGSGFGGKLWPWPHSVLAAAAARQLNRPVKLVLHRRMMFTNVGHRPRTQQRVRIGATKDGKLLALQQDFVNHTSILDDYKEDCGEATAHMYSTPNLRVTSSLARRNVGTPTAMRGPGAVPGLWAIESAMDEMAVALKMDPVQVRLVNEPEKDEGLNVPFTSRHLKECYALGMEKFGWSRRDAKVGSMKRDGMTLGWGMAACTWMAQRFPCQAAVDLREDGTARVACGTQDIGTGTYTVLAQVAAEKLGIPMEKIQVDLGDTSLPAGPISGGSMVTASVIPAVLEATGKAIEALLESAAKTKFTKQKPDELAFTAGRVHPKQESADQGVAFGDILKLGKLKSVSGRGNSAATFGQAKPKVSSHSFGAHFVEVTWQPEIARLRVSRVVSVIDAGRIINPLAGRNQIEGAVVMGIGMALLEETSYDTRTGGPVNANLADYLVAVNTDVPKLEVHFVDHPDTHLNVFGARGIGEIGLAGMAAAIANAVYHATGKRFRDLPIKIEHLLD